MRLDISSTDIAVAIGAFLVSTAVTTGIVAFFLVRIRADYFVAETRGITTKFRSSVTQTLYMAGKNLLGLLLIVLGVILTLPGVPGQGLLTILVGLLLVDLPGKRNIELRLVSRPGIRRNIDRLRARFDKPPLDLDGVVDTEEAEEASDAAHHEESSDPDMADS
jgi:hypothetical protein